MRGDSDAELVPCPYCGREVLERDILVCPWCGREGCCDSDGGCMPGGRGCMCPECEDGE